MDDPAGDSRQAPPFPDVDAAEVVRVRLVPEDDPQPLLLRELTELFAAAVAEAFGTAGPPRVPFVKPPRHESAGQRQAVAEAMDEIARIADASGPASEAQKEKLRNGGPAAIAAEVRRADAAIRDAVRWCRENGLRPGVRVSYATAQFIEGGGPTDVIFPLLRERIYHWTWGVITDREFLSAAQALLDGDPVLAGWRVTGVERGADLFITTVRFATPTNTPAALRVRSSRRPPR